MVSECLILIFLSFLIKVLQEIMLNRKQSTGIGLYLVKKLCDELQIEIDVESKYEEGFVIQFLFPKIEV